MPLKPKHPCCRTGCPELVERGQSFCDAHGREEQRRYDSEREGSTKRGYGIRWQRYREWFLRENKFCMRCGRLANEVDHIEPVKPDDPRFWDSKNHQALCKTCHSRKTAKEGKRWGDRES